MTKKGESSKKPRRDYGEGSLSKRPDGRWQGSFYDNGKRRYVYGETGGTRLECLQLLKAAIARAKQGSLIAVDKLTVGQYMREWLENKHDYRANSKQSASYAINKHIIPHAMGSIQIQKITTRHVESWISYLQGRGLRPKSVHRYYEVVHAALEHAVKTRTIAHNPCAGVTLPPVVRAKQVILNQEQCRLFLEALEEHRWLRPIILLALATAMRKSELLALRWSDIELKGGTWNDTGISATLYVRHNRATISYVGIVEGPPKTKSSARKIQLPQFALDMLKSHRIEQKVKRMATRPEWKDMDLVFPNPHGEFLPEGTLDSAFTRAIQNVAVPQVTFHGLRHSAATLLLSMGVPAKVVQEILGHSSIAMTLDIYGQVMEHQQDDAAQKMDAAFKKKAK